jgi:hypothetical protein
MALRISIEEMVTHSTLGYKILWIFLSVFYVLNVSRYPYDSGHNSLFQTSTWSQMDNPVVEAIE